MPISTLSTGQQSYASAIEAAEWLADRGREADFAGLVTEDIEQRLLAGMDYLESSYNWAGSPADVSQALSWPRVNAYNRNGLLYGSDEIPSALVAALVELAVIANNNSNRVLQSEREAGVKSVKAGSVQVTFAQDNTPGEAERLASVDRIIDHLIASRAGANSGIANIALMPG